MNITVVHARLDNRQCGIDVDLVVKEIIQLFPGAKIVAPDWQEAVKADRRRRINAGLLTGESVETVLETIDDARERTGVMQAIEIPIASGNALWGTVSGTDIFLKGAVPPDSPEIKQLKNLLDLRGWTKLIEVMIRSVPDGLRIALP